MATARELLAQADALMRRNRLREEVRVIPPVELVDIPILTEVVEPGAPVGPHPSQIDIEQAIDVAELETEAAVAAATDAALAREAAANGAEPADAIEGPAPTSAVAGLESIPAAPPPAADTARTPVDALSIAVPAGPGDPVREDDDVPMLTEAVVDFEPTSILGIPEDASDAAAWDEFDDDLALAAESLRATHPGAPESRDDPPPSQSAPFETPMIDEPPAAPPAPAIPAAAAFVAAAVPPAIDAGDTARWTALAEEIRMQVLQRIDIFTDTGLQEQLTARLQPIVDRASADLVATINQQVGQLLRAYVAEAIEREIDRWREDAG